MYYTNNAQTFIMNSLVVNISVNETISDLFIEGKLFE